MLALFSMASGLLGLYGLLRGYSKYKRRLNENFIDVFLLLSGTCFFVWAAFI